MSELIERINHDRAEIESLETEIATLCIVGSGMEERIERLEAENQKLRAAVDAAITNLKGVKEKLAALHGEQK